MGAGIENRAGVLTVTGSTFAHNQALGGNGGSGPLGGNAVGGGIHNGVGAVATITGSTFAHNRAIGGSRGSGDVRTGPGLGGGVDNQGRATVTESTFDHNRAIGGSFDIGSNAGAGAGGGLYNGTNATLALFGCLVTGNQADGGAGGAGGSHDQGVGGGVFNLGVFDPDASVIKKNHSSTSNRDIFS
ncbi:MAG TPA: hypothetical protein VKP69_19445 [Isosphaeraceae bacterium]|nr:hypothetical protein [Isosphaeraceae bacterium]